MLIHFFYFLRAKKLNVSIQEFMSLLECLCSPAAPVSIDEFYYLARLVLIKDESLFDRYDQAFAEFYHALAAELTADGLGIPDDWLIKTLSKHLSDEEKAALQTHSLEELLELFKKTLAEQKERHAGGNKWVGTGGSSPFGHGGYHPQGIRIGGPSAGNFTATKVWEKREYKDYDDQMELGTRNFKVALRRLRRFARQGAATELDLPSTIRHTAQQGGLLDIQMQAERKNTVKVLMLLDVGGSMDRHIEQVEALFSAARTEFKHLEVYYFHNCPYEWLWRDNARRFDERIATNEVLHHYNDDWRLVMVGDATMNPYEITHAGGAIDYHNNEAGHVWLTRILDQWPHAVWLNPTPTRLWHYHRSLYLVRQLTNDRMYPVTMQGLESAMQLLTK